MNRPLVFVADCARFVWELALFVNRWAWMTLAFYGLAVLLLARSGTAADAENLVQVIITKPAPLLAWIAGLSLIAMCVIGAFTATPLFRLPPRWSTWIDQHQSRLEAGVATWWAKIPDWKQKAIGLALVGSLSGAFIWMVSQAPERNPPELPPVISPRETVR